MGITPSLQYSECCTQRSMKFKKSGQSFRISVRALLQLNHNIVPCSQLEEVGPWFRTHFGTFVLKNTSFFSIIPETFIKYLLRGQGTLLVAGALKTKLDLSPGWKGSQTSKQRLLQSPCQVWLENLVPGVSLLPRSGET